MTISYEPDLSVKQIRERADVRYAIGDVGAAIAGHLKAMLAVSEYRRIIVPPVPAFYTKSSNLDEMVEHTAGRILDLFGFDVLTKGWDCNRAQLNHRTDEGILHYENRNHRLG